MSTAREFSLIDQHLKALDVMQRVIKSHRLESLNQEFKDLLCEFLCGVRANCSKLEEYKRNLTDAVQFVNDMEQFLTESPH